MLEEVMKENEAEENLKDALTSKRLQRLYSHSYTHQLLKEAKRMQAKQKERNNILLSMQCQKIR